MPDKTTKKYKHLTFDEREEIQGCLNHGMTFKAIGQRIGKDQTTISKEVKRHLVSQPLEHRAFDREGNPLPPEPCPRHLKSPFCCNPCEQKHRLRVSKKTGTVHLFANLVYCANCNMTMKKTNAGGYGYSNVQQLYAQARARDKETRDKR